MTQNNTKKVDFFAREPHHAQHAKAIYDKMPEAHKGIFTDDFKKIIVSDNEHVAVFSYGDLRHTQHTRKKVIFGEHGAGMYYNGTAHPSYAGSTQGRNNVVLRLSPNKTHAKKEMETLKGVPVSIVGMPKMDEWAAHRDDFQKTYDPDRTPVVAVSFHWNCRVCPETMSSYKHFAHVLDQVDREFTLIGHGHPRIMNEMRHIYRTLDIKVCADWRRVMKEADIYVCDNSSTIFEFAYLRKPVVLLNAPNYRKNVTHEGNPRFWKYANIGPQVDDPATLTAKIWEAWDDYPKFLPLIDKAVDDVFTYTDGKCAERAVAEIIKILQ